MRASLETWLPLLAALAALLAAGHAVLNKREVRSATAWVGLILLVPGLGALLYLLLGINRIVARFLLVLAPWSVAFANLRNHRKIMVVDGRVGFTGGMNVRHACVSAASPRTRTLDVHFRFDGPVVTELMDVFAEDWTFATRETLSGESWFPDLAPVGTTIARVISDGPDRDLDCLRWALLGALGCPRRSARVLTPYFLPDDGLITALNAAALRGVEVDSCSPNVATCGS